MGQSLYTVRIKPRQTPRECLIPAVIDRLYPSSAVAPRPVARVADRPAGVTFQYDRHRHVRDLHHVHVRQGDRQGTCAFDRACFDCFVYARARRSRRSRTAVGGAESCRARAWWSRSRGSIAGIDRGDRSRASASSSSRRPRARVACVEFYVLRRHIHARACDVARRRTTTARVPSSSVAKTSLANACVRACVRAWTDRMRRVFRDSRCNSALARRRASKLARRCAPPCDSPSTPPRYVRRSRARSRAHPRHAPGASSRRSRLDRIASIDAIDRSDDRPMRSIDRSIDRNVKRWSPPRDVALGFACL